MLKRSKSLQTTAVTAEAKSTLERSSDMKLVTTRVAIAASALFLAAGLVDNAVAAASSIYLAQSAAGSGDGSSCTNARAASSFNSASNWGTGATQIGAGTTVHLCGTVTTSLTFQGSGTSTAAVTLDGTGATYAGAISTGANLSWWRIQNVTWASTFTGVPITVLGGSNGVITGNRADNVQGGQALFIGQYNGAAMASNIDVGNNYFRTTNADMGNTQHDLIDTEGSTNVTIEGNYLEMRAGGAGNQAHDDIIQTWQKGGTNAGPPSNWTIRYNMIVMNSAATNDRSWMMLENLTGTVNIYSNVLVGLSGADSANGIATDSDGSGVVLNIFNNTIVAKGTASNNVMNLNAPGAVNVRNNIVDTVAQEALVGNMAVTRDHNLWVGANVPNCGSTELCQVNPQFTDYTNDNFMPAVNSPILASGVNLGATYGKAIAVNATWPNPTLVDRPTTGNWALGAYATTATAVVLPAPTSLRVN